MRAATAGSLASYCGLWGVVMLVRSNCRVVEGWASATMPFTHQLLAHLVVGSGSLAYGREDALHDGGDVGLERALGVQSVVVTAPD